MEKTMAERFLAYYREWANLTPEDHERSGGTFTDLSEFARARAAAAGSELSYLQWWNCKPCTEQQGAPIPNTVSEFAVIEFHDGSYAFSPRPEQGERRWLVGVPAA